ncbi:hypothetical protein Goklo_005698 [Gossypium klotzschianum]|uniref:Uncharacterized protein n=1 Tax=Gossypium klotzschianum TaxID=34286 RepID=A0A7J8VF07_9ROSI|nr:hypothetical protein [Gossypium klotzschianum]
MLYMFNNNLSCLIPEEIRNLYSLVKLGLSQNQLNGFILASLGSLSNLETLFLRDNRLLGSQPIGMLRRAITGSSQEPYNGKLMRANNGTLFPAMDLWSETTVLISLKTDCYTLNLSHNNLSGEIPASLEKLRGLYTIDIAYNELHCPVPNCPTFLNSSIQELRGNKGLCGNASGLPPCTPFSKKGHKNNKTLYIVILPLLSTTDLLISSIALLFAFKKRKKDA